MKADWEDRDRPWKLALARYLAEGLDLLRRPMGEIGEGAVVDFAVLAEALAEKDGGRGVAVGDDGHVHVDIIRQLSLQIKSNY